MGSSKEKKKKSRQKYELERRQIELEEQLLDIQRRRLDLEQQRVELQLKKVRLVARRPRHTKSAPSGLIGDNSVSGRSDDESSFLTAPTVASTQHENSDNSGDIAWFSSQRSSGYESGGEEAACPPKGESKPHVSEANPSVNASAAFSVPFVPNVKPEHFKRSSSENLTLSTKVHGGKLESSAKRAVQSMRNLVSSKPSSEELERSAASLRDLLADKHAEAVTMLNDCCNRSTETFHSGQTKVTSNVSEGKKRVDRGRPYPSLKEDRSSRHNNDRNLSTSDLQNGEFVYTWPDGRRYEGSWKDGKFHGLGVHTWPNGGKYVGQYRNGLKMGLRGVRLGRRKLV